VRVVSSDIALTLALSPETGEGNAFEVCMHRTHITKTLLRSTARAMALASCRYALDHR
jgi:hypothetical protein